MVQTPAILSKLALRPSAPAAGKALEKLAGNGQERFANLLDENASESGATPKGNDSSGSAEAMHRMGAQAAGLSGRKGQAEKAGAGKGYSELSSPSGGQEATELQPIYPEYASPSVPGIFLALGSAQIQSPPVTPNASGTAEPPATEFAQQAMALANSLGAIYQSKRQTGTPANSKAAGSFTILGLQTHFAPETSPGLKFAQALERTKPESTRQTSTSDPTAISSVSVSAEPLAEVKDAGSHRKSPSSEKSLPAEEQAMQSAEPAVALPAQAGGQPPPSPIQQIFNAIEEAMPAGAPAAMQANQLAPDGYAPVKSLTIAFDPQGLGTVSIELSIKDSELGVRVEASEAGTAQLLKEDDGALTKLLEAGGYTVGSVSVQLSPQPQPANTQAQTGPGGQSGFSMSTSTGGGGSAGTGGQEGEANQRHDRKGSGYGRSEGANRDRSLYV